MQFFFFLFYFTRVVWLVRLFFSDIPAVYPGCDALYNYYDDDDDVDDHYNIIIRDRSVLLRFPGIQQVHLQRPVTAPRPARRRRAVGIIWLLLLLSFDDCVRGLFPKRFSDFSRPADRVTPRVGRAIASFLHDRRRRTFCQWTSSHLKRTLIINAVNARAARVDG